MESGHTRCGAIDATATIRIPLVFSRLTSFKDGIALAQKASGKWTFIGRQPIGQAEVEYEAAAMFRNGLASVKRAGLWGFIDRTGRLIVAPQFLDVAPRWKFDYEYLTGEAAAFMAEHRQH